MSDNVLVIPATFMVGQDFSAHLPLSDGSMKPLRDCSVEEVQQAVVEMRAVAEGSRNRLHTAYEEHTQDLEILAQVSAYAARDEQWAALREDEPVQEILWSMEREPDSDAASEKVTS
ncbi:MAG: hypothetical protein ACJ0SL_08585 [Candidatus Rariloculaceae bacterium]